MGTSAWTPVDESTSAWTPVEEHAPSSTNTLFQGAKDVIGGIWNAATGSKEQDEIQQHLAKGEYGHAIMKAAEAGAPGFRLFVEPAIEQATKAYNLATHGRYSEAVGHGLAALIPGVGPAAAQMTETAVGEPTQAPNQQLEPPRPGEPMRALGQLGTQAALGAAPKGLALVPKVAEAAGIPDMLRGSASKEYAQVLNPTTKANKNITQRIVPRLLDENIRALTMKGLQQQAQGHIAALGEAIGNAWDNLPEGTTTELKPVYDKLQSEIDQVHSVADSSGKMIPKGPEAERAISNIESLQQVLTDVAEMDPATGKLAIPVDKIRDLRQYFDGIAANKGGYSGAQLADQSTASAHRLAANAIREELGKDFPDIAEINKDYSFWKNVDQVTSDTILRRQGQAKPLGRKLARTGGQILGGTTGGLHGAILGGVAMDAIEAATSSPAWRTVSAVLKNRLANALSTDDATAANGALSDIQKSIGAGSGMAQPKEAVNE